MGDLYLLRAHDLLPRASLITHLKAVVCRRTPISSRLGLQRIPHSSRRRCCTGGSQQARRAPWRQCAARPHTYGLPPLCCRLPTRRGEGPANNDRVVAERLRRSLSRARSSGLPVGIGGSIRSPNSFAQVDIREPKELS